MTRYAHGSFFYYYYYYMFFFFFFIPSVYSQLPANQTATMTKLSQLLENNTGNSSWNNTRDPNPCSWKGVTCTPTNSSITRLSFSNFGLSSSDFLPEICQLDSLESLDLSHNLLTSIPDRFITDCGKINGLKKLNMSSNNLSGPVPVFTGFAKLEALDMSKNTLSGNIDVQFDGLVDLKSLNFSLNLLHGSLPSKFGTFLEELQLSKNNLSGQIPNQLFKCTNLTLLDLSVNRLSGSVSVAIGELSKLETILLSANSFTGIIPTSLSNIRTLSRFSANQNQFSGTIPRGFSQSLKSLDLSYNKLLGIIPNDLLLLPNLGYVDLSYNSLGGSIPTNVSSSVFRLRLGSNNFTGEIPAITLSKITYLELDNNSLSGQIPVALGNCKSLALLNLANNKLMGLLPKELGNLPDLQVLKLQSNRLTGKIPEQLLELKNLSTLNISGNSLTGSIPSNISRLGMLMNLNLQNNQLNGSIPLGIGDLNLLLELQLGKNFLSGNIPPMPPKLQIALNLSNNLFQGPIPEILSRLTALEVLDLSNNTFTGKVPKFLTEMASLTRLLLSKNLLSGILPKFRSFVIVDIAGNKDLINTTSPSTTNSKAELSKKRSPIVVAIVVAIVAAIVGVIIMGAIVCTVSRRFYRVNDENVQNENVQNGEPSSSPQAIIDGHLITTNSIHKSGIDFTTAMEAVSNPTNIVLKTRFSTYYKAVMPGGKNYYVKKLNWSDKIFQLGSHERFGQELEALGRLTNSNIMIPLAYVLTVDSAYVFHEYAEEGTLFDAIHGSVENSLDWGSRYSIAVGVAQGLAFLHGCMSPVLLLDLSTKNILLKSLKEPKIGDIELCKVIDPSKSIGSLSTIAGSVGYIPPEYAYTMRVTAAGNVYSFGVILLELLTGKPAVSEGTELAKWVLTNSIQRSSWDRILDPTVSKTSLVVQTQMLAVLKIALSCVGVSPEARPQSRNVLRMLINAR